MDNIKSNTGLYQDEKGRVSINYNEFCRYLCTKKHLLYSSFDERFYVYKKGVYIFLKETVLNAFVRKEMNKIVADCWKPAYQNNILQTLKSETLTNKEFNKNLQVLNLRNGLFDLKTFHIQEHTPEFLSTIQLPIVYDKNAKCPNFIEFLHEIFENDEERIKLIQQLFGYCLTSSTKAQKAFILYGSGANGKSVLLNVLIELVGKENISTLPINNFKDPFRIVSLMNKNVNIVAEGNFKSNTFCSETFKAVIAGDNCFGEYKYGASISFQPYCKIIIAVNKLPDIKDNSYGMERRLVVIPFNRIFKPEEQDKSLTQRLLKELPGIFNFALTGLQELHKNKYNFVVSKACEKASREFFHHNNPLKEFVETHVYESPRSKITYKELSEKYLQWLFIEGIPAPNSFNRREFSIDIKKALDNLEIPYQTGKKSNGNRLLTGIAIKNKSYQQNEQEDLNL